MSIFVDCANLSTQSSGCWREIRMIPQDSEYWFMLSITPESSLQQQVSRMCLIVLPDCDLEVWRVTDCKTVQQIWIEAHEMESWTTKVDHDSWPNFTTTSDGASAMGALSICAATTANFKVFVRRATWTPAILFYIFGILSESVTRCVLVTKHVWVWVNTCVTFSESMRFKVWLREVEE